MQRIPVALLALSVPIALLTSVGPADAATPSFVVKGHVTSPSGEPVAGVLVTVRGKEPRARAVTRTARTSASGRYEVRLPADRTVYDTPDEYPDDYRLVVSDPGDADHDTADGTWAPATVHAQSTARTVRIDAVVHHGARLSGRVLDAAGKPARAGLPVTVLRRLPESSRSRYRALGTTSTRSDGTYRFTNLPGGAAVIEFGSPSPATAARFWDTTGDGTRDLDAAGEVALAYGRRTGDHDIRFPVAARIAGALTVDGRPLPGDDGRVAEVHLLDADGNELDREPAYASFGFPDLEPGTYLLRFDGTALYGDGIQPEYWQDASTLGEATPIVVGRGEQVTGLRVQLASR